MIEQLEKLSLKDGDMLVSCWTLPPEEFQKLQAAVRHVAPGARICLANGLLEHFSEQEMNAAGWYRKDTLELGIAYLEISPRQTGKTGRLISIASGLLSAGTRVTYVTSQGSKSDVQARLPGALVLADTDPFPPGENPRASVWFYDEFDWLQGVQIRPGAYYATTPKRLRQAGKDTPENDKLLALLRANGNRFNRVLWPMGLDAVADVIDEARLSMSDHDFRGSYLGEFLA